MSSTWSGHLPILPPRIYSPFFGNKTPISTGAPMWAPLPGLGDHGADLAEVRHSVSPAAGAGSGGYGAR